MNPFNLTKPISHPHISFPRGLGAAKLAAQDPVVLPPEFRKAKEPEVVFPPDDTPKNAHREILIEPKFLDHAICDEYVQYAKQQPEVDLSVFDSEATNKQGKIAWRIDKGTRDTQFVDIEPIRGAVIDLMRHAVQQYLNPFFNVQIKDSEEPQFLIYHEGGHYRPHIDAEALWNDGSGKLQWVRNVDRDISLILYFNDDFEGGEIVFPKQAISIRPKKGMLVAFPSTHHYLHGVNPVVKGTRYAMVNWFSLGIHGVHESVRNP